MRGFNKVFIEGNTGPPLSLISKNHKSTVSFASVIDDFIADGITNNRIAGPFASPPFEHFVSSPFVVVPKAEQGKYRVIHDLSFPKHHSVNYHIPQENHQFNMSLLIM